MTDLRTDREETAVYRLRDEAGTLIYVGVSVHPPDRYDEHAHQDWWEHVYSVEEEWFPTRAEAMAVELQVIRTEQPRCNKASNPDWHPGMKYGRERRTERIVVRLTREEYDALEAMGGGERSIAATFRFLLRREIERRSA